MKLPQNKFKRALVEGRQQIGLWCSIPSPYSTEIVAGSGFDWLLLDTEHSPSDPITVLSLLQAASAYDVTPIVRPASNDPVLIKRFLDIGAQTLLIPYVQSEAEARAAVAATRYPPAGMRGVAAQTRATQFGRVTDYGRLAEAEICLLLQVETVQALEELEAIAAIDGVHGIFIGPGDLAASMGHIGDLGNAKVKAGVEDALKRVIAAGKPAGVLTADAEFARRCIEIGTTFTAVGADTGLLARGSEKLARDFKG